MELLLIFLLLILFFSFLVLLSFIFKASQQRFDSEGIFIGSVKYLWRDIEAISCLENTLSNALYQIKVKEKVYTTSLIFFRGIDKFIKTINETGLYNIVQEDVYGYPTRWTKKDLDYQTTGRLDKLKDYGFFFNRITGVSSNVKKVSIFLFLIVLCTTFIVVSFVNYFRR